MGIVRAAALYIGARANKHTADPGQPVYSDDYVEITLTPQWGIKYLHCKFNANITVAEFDAIPRSVHQANMDEYFRATIDVFEQRKGLPVIPHQVCLAGALRGAAISVVVALGTAVLFVAAASIMANGSILLILSALAFLVATVLTLLAALRLTKRIMTDKLWPGFMEERMKNRLAHVFAKADSDIRSVIDKFVEVFLDNNRQRIHYKRSLQWRTILGLFLGVLPLFVLPTSYSLVIWGPAALWTVAVCATCLGVFKHDNNDLFANAYYHTLNLSAQEISTVIMHRMTSLTALFQNYYNNIQKLEVEGEDLNVDEISKLTDAQLKEGTGFFATRMLIWLAKRLEAVEESLMADMQTAESVLAVLNIAGYITSTVIKWVSLALVVLCTVGSICWHGGYDHFALLAALPPLVGGCLLMVMIWVVSYYSFHYTKWNSGRDILRKCFQTATVSGWNTCAKLEFDIRLAARCQLALARIKHLDKKTGFGGK